MIIILGGWENKKKRWREREKARRFLTSWLVFSHQAAGTWGWTARRCRGRIVCWKASARIQVVFPSLSSPQSFHSFRSVKGKSNNSRQCVKLLHLHTCGCGYQGEVQAAFRRNGIQAFRIISPTLLLGIFIIPTAKQIFNIHCSATSWQVKDTRLSPQNFKTKTKLPQSRIVQPFRCQYQDRIPANTTSLSSRHSTFSVRGCVFQFRSGGSSCSGPAPGQRNTVCENKPTCWPGEDASQHCTFKALVQFRCQTVE